MKPIRTPDCNTTLTLEGAGRDHDLPCVRALLFDPELGQTPSDARIGHVSRWMPDEKEAQRLEAGGCVELTIWGERHPAVSVAVSEAVIPERELIDRGHVDRALGHLYAQLFQLDYFSKLDGPPIGPSEFADLYNASVEATRTDRTDATLDPLVGEAIAAIDTILPPTTPDEAAARQQAHQDHRDRLNGEPARCDACEAGPHDPCHPDCETNRAP